MQENDKSSLNNNSTENEWTETCSNHMWVIRSLCTGVLRNVIE